MPKENQSDPRKQFVLRILPWLLGGAMLLVYWLTLNPWVNLANVRQIAAVSGWTWQPQLYNPLFFLVTLPFRLLPAAHLPLLLNIFSAACAAATLMILARSVAILPHDRTEMERDRERSDFSFLTGWLAWIPPIVAVFFCALQLGFWQHATNFTGESFDLLIFAAVIWQLLEYRLDERESRIYTATFLFSAGITENWGMIGFTPLFFMMVIWLRKLDFFNVNFLLGFLFSGLAGLLFLFALPVMAKATSFYPISIWEVLKINLLADWQVIHSIKLPGVRHDFLLISLTSLFPAFVMSIRWSASFGDSSKLGAMLVNYVMHLVNAMIFGVLLWVMFDPPFSPRQLMRDFSDPPYPVLTLYYITALCIGYFCGYALLIFGRAPIPTRRNPRPDPVLPRFLLWLCPIILAGILACTVVAAGLLIWKNAPIIRAQNSDTMLKYAQLATQDLPKQGAILLCDSDNPSLDIPLRGYFTQAVLARQGRANEIPVVDTKSLDWIPYHKYLHDRFPKIWPAVPPATNEVYSVNPLYIFALLNQLSRSNNIYYLNPSYGYYFEQFYQEPHGLVYLLKTLPNENLLPPPLDTKLLAENTEFWKQTLEATRRPIEQALHPAGYNNIPGILGKIVLRLHLTPETDPSAVMVGTIFSRNLNYLGVKAQRAGDLETAAPLFADAIVFNSNNVVAGINLDFNKSLRRGSATEINASQRFTDKFGVYKGWDQVLNANGPFDETSFCFAIGVNFMQNGYFHQAAEYFDRVRRLVPDNLATRLFLAQIYVLARLPNPALEVLQDPLAHPLRFALTEYNSTELHVLASAAYFQNHQDADAVKLLDAEIERHPDNDLLLTSTAQSYIMRGLYTNALRVIDRKLARTPDDLEWIYGKAYSSLQIGAYADAVAAYNKILAVQTNNLDAVFNRAIAYLQSGQLDFAKADYTRLQTGHTNAFQIAYGLGEIAYRRHETNEALRNFEIYMANAPTNSLEYKSVRDHLTELRGK